MNQIEMPAYGHDRNGTSRILDQVPDVCPHCQLKIHARRIYAHIEEGEDHYDGRLSVLLGCPSCGRSFLAYYEQIGPDPINVDFQRIAPATLKQETFPDTIRGVSSSFVEIYNQALAAEAHDLHQVCGCGYRKALEFLIKDYVVSKEEENKAVIHKMLLAQVITQHIEAPRIRDLAERAAWLGNDETHYHRKWENKDIGDLKRLIHLVVNYIDSDLVAEDMIKGMPIK